MLDALDDLDGGPRDPQADDELVHVEAARATGVFTGRHSGGSTRGSPHASPHGNTRDLVRPVLTVCSEHTTVERTPESAAKQHLTCMISVEVPSRYPPLPAAVALLAQIKEARPRTPSRPAPGLPHSASEQSLSSTPGSASPTPSSATSAGGHGTITAMPSQRGLNELARAVIELRDRMVDWKGHSLDEFGGLRLYDSVSVRKDSVTRDFVVYLFDEAILCVSDEKRKGPLAYKVIGAGARGIATDKVRLKGRVYLRHVRAVTDTSTGDELSLTFAMNDEAVAEFVMIFRERTTLRSWKAQVDMLLSARRAARLRVESTYPQTPASAYPPPRKRQDESSDLSISDRSYFTASTGPTHTIASSLAPSPSTIPEEPTRQDDFGAVIPKQAVNVGTPPSMPICPGSFSGPPTADRDFTSLDLMVIVSVPPAGAGTLKTEIIKNALHCLVANAGPLTRIALVAFTAGEGSRGMLRKTPFLAVGRTEGRNRLETAIDELALETTSLSALANHKEDRISVVTACNLALDGVMQRKAGTLDCELLLRSRD